MSYNSKYKGSEVEELLDSISYIEPKLMWVKAEDEAGVRLKGTNGTATGNLAISAGDDKTASDGTAFTSTASGDHAVVFGFGNTCAGRTTLAQGLYNVVTGKDSVAFGQRNTVNGDQAFAAGQQNEVASRLCVTLGYQNKATNTNSIAIGYKNTSSGSGSVALGDTCESNGVSSTAMGYKTKATGAYTSTFGENTQATNQGEVAMGLYNKSTTSTDTSEQTAFSFGIGTSDTNRSNAFEIKKNGDVYIGDKMLNEKMSVWDEKQDELVSGTNIKTINGQSILGSGDVKVQTEANIKAVDTAESIDDVEVKYQEKLISGTNIKTINNKSILGNGNIVIESGLSEIAYPKIVLTSSTVALKPNTFYVWNTYLNSIDVSFVEGNPDVMNEYVFQFMSGTTPTTLILPDTVQWVDGIPIIEENKVYQVSIVNNIGLIISI